MIGFEVYVKSTGVLRPTLILKSFECYLCFLEKYQASLL